MKRLFLILAVAACQGGDASTDTPTVDAAGTELGDEGPATCLPVGAEAEPVDPGTVVDGYPASVDDLVAALEGSTGDGTATLVLSADPTTATFTDLEPVEYTDDGQTWASTGACPDTLTVFAEVELDGGLLQMPPTLADLRFVAGGDTLWSTSALVAWDPAPDLTDDETGTSDDGADPELTDWVIDASLHPTSFDLDNVASAELFVTGIATVDGWEVSLLWYGNDLEDSYEEEGPTWSFARP